VVLPPEEVPVVPGPVPETVPEELAAAVLLVPVALPAEVPVDVPVLVPVDEAELLAPEEELAVDPPVIPVTVV
jgi:hypothetical protein